MATFNPGTNGTIKSTTIEGAVFELLNWMRDKELNPPDGRTYPNKITGTMGLGSRLLVASVSLDAVQSLSQSSDTMLIPVNYLAGTIFNAPNDGEINADNPCRYLLALLTKMQNYENDPGKNPDQENRVTATYDFDTGTYECSISLPLAITLNPNGSVNVSVTEYLS